MDKKRKYDDIESEESYDSDEVVDLENYDSAEDSDYEVIVKTV